MTGFKFDIKQEVWFISNNNVNGNHFPENMELNGFVEKRMRVGEVNKYLIQLKTYGKVTINENHLSSRFSIATFKK